MNRNHVQRHIEAFEQLHPSTLQPLEDCFSERARFVDPFNDVRGKLSVRRVFEQMFASCENPAFGVEKSLGDDTLVNLKWHFRFGNAASRRRVYGVSRVQFTSDGFVSEHRDYWDPASQMYEKLPVLGKLFRVLRHRLAAPQGSDHDTNIRFSAISKRNLT